MENEKKGSVLIVDDDAVIRGMLQIELEERYLVFAAGNAAQAFHVLNTEKVDLVISDINMPGMKGYDLLRAVKERYPAIKTALITAYNTDDYIRMAKEINISNIITKSVPFNFDEFNSIVSGLINENIFGLANHMFPDYTVMGEFVVHGSGEIIAVEEKVLAAIASFHEPEPYVQILLEELITNAVYHAPVDKEGHVKYIKHSEVELEENEVVRITLGRDSEKYAVSVVDTSGKLAKEQVLYRIDRHVHAEGVLDENGRGLHMSRLYADRLLINIKRNTITEVIFINYIDRKYQGFKPLYINEL